MIYIYIYTPDSNCDLTCVAYKRPLLRHANPLAILIHLIDSDGWTVLHLVTEPRLNM